MKNKKTHIFILRITLFIIVVFILLSFIYLQIFGYKFNLLTSIVFLIVSFIAIYLLLSYSIKVFSRKKIKKIYNSSFFKNEPVHPEDDTDLDELLSKIEIVLENKHKEIAKLHNRDDFRKEFIGNVSHELKTPLFTAQGYILTLLDGDILDKKQHRKYLQKAAKSIERLDFIVKDLDMISRLETGTKLKFETFNIVKLINDVMDMLEIKAGKKNITLTFDKMYKYPLFVTADMKRIEQVLINLISNSINYGKINGTTTVCIKNYLNDKFIIKIKDDGIGIDSKDIPRLFERFYRVDKSRSRKQGGSGLGLSIVKHIVEAHRQQIFVESKEGEGSVFSFTLKKIK